jgi:Rab GDP dissociation inhibitor
MIKQENLSICQINKNNFFGEESPSLNLTQLWNYFCKDKNPPEQYGENKDWNVDLIPKLMMPNSHLITLLLITEVYHYIEWKNIEEVLVYQYDKGGVFSSAKGKIYKVPSSQDEVSNSELMGMFEKIRCKKFFNFIQNYNENENPKVNNACFKDVINQFGLEFNTIDFIGHAVALYSNNNFMEDKAINVIKKIKFYLNYIEPKNKTQFFATPFIYPIWGLQKLYKNYERQCYLYDFKYLKNCKIENILYDANGKFEGIQTSNEKIYGTILISEPSYMEKFNKVQIKRRIIRRICLMNHPISSIGECDSCQIIIPQNQIGKKNDIFILQLGYGHCITKKGYYVVVISTFDDESDINKQLAPAMEIIGNTLECFDKTYSYYEPIDNSFSNNIFITNSLLPQSHFENDFDDIIDIFQKITDAKLQFEPAKKNNKD